MESNPFYQKLTVAIPLEKTRLLGELMTAIENESDQAKRNTMEAIYNIFSEDVFEIPIEQPILPVETNPVKPEIFQPGELQNNKQQKLNFGYTINTPTETPQYVTNESFGVSPDIFEFKQLITVRDRKFIESYENFVLDVFENTFEFHRRFLYGIDEEEQLNMIAAIVTRILDGKIQFPEDPTERYALYREVSRTIIVLYEIQSTYNKLNEIDEFFDSTPFNRVYFSTSCYVGKDLYFLKKKYTYFVEKINLLFKTQSITPQFIEDAFALNELELPLQINSSDKGGEVMDDKQNNDTSLVF